jgi:hypothetical protein
MRDNMRLERGVAGARPAISVSARGILGNLDRSGRVCALGDILPHPILPPLSYARRKSASSTTC